MGSPKAEVTHMLDALPESATFEDIQYHLYVLEKIKRGITRAEREGVANHDQARDRLRRWLTE